MSRVKTEESKCHLIESCARVLSCFVRDRLCNPVDCNPPGCSVHGILQARTLECVAMPSSRGFFQPRDQTSISYDSFIAGKFKKKKKKKLEVVIVWLPGVKVERMIPDFLAAISLQMGVTFTLLWNFKSEISISHLDVLVYCSGVWATGKNQWLEGPAKETGKGLSV